MNFSTPTKLQQHGTWMVKQWFALVLLAATVTQVFGADDIYRHFGFSTNWPAIDATVFDNRGTFRDLMTAYPADTTDTQTFLNRGEMSGQVGFRFDLVTSTTRKAALSFTNFESGVVNGLDNPVAYWGFILSANGNFLTTTAPASPASYCIVNANSLANRGLLEVGNVGLMRLSGTDVDLTRGTLAAGQVSDYDTNLLFNQLSFSNGFGSFAGFFNFAGDGSALGLGFNAGFEYFNPPHVYDLFWGVGLSNSYPPGVLLDPNDPTGLTVVSPTVSVNGRNGPLVTPPSSLSIPVTSDAHFDAKAYESVIGSNYFISIIFYKTNSEDGAVNVDAEFATNGASFFSGLDTPDFIVQFADTNVVDVTTGKVVTNAIYLIDHASGGFLVDSNAVSVGGRFGRPDNFEVTTVQPPEWLGIVTNDFDPDTFSPGLVPYDPLLIEGDPTSQGFYLLPAANSSIYGAQVGRNPETINGLTVETNPVVGQFAGYLQLPELTNDVPRIEINATNLNVAAANIRSEGLMLLNVKNLINGGTAGTDVGALIGDIGTTTDTLQISNVVPSTFKRVRGNIYAWSGTVTGNTIADDGNGGFTTNFVTTRILIVDHSLRGAFTPTFQKLTLHGTTTVLQDNLIVNKSLLIDADSLTIDSTVRFTELMQDFRAANAPHLKNLFIETNGALIVDNTAYIGWDRPDGLDTFINHGLFVSTAPLIKASYVQNTGTIDGTNGGSIIIQADTVDLGKNPPPTSVAVNTLVADRDVEIHSGTVNATNSTIIAGTNGTIGMLTLDCSDTLTDFVPNVPGTNNVLINYWQANNGVVVPQRANGDLYGTELYLIATNRNEAQIVWAGVDAGAGSDAFNNNLVVGHVVLDRADSKATFHFSAADYQNAMYIDYLELRGMSLSDVANALVIDDNMTIYFASANVDAEKLQAAFTKSDGTSRVVWANSFTGPNSSVAVARSDSSTCLMNFSLRDSTTIDSDLDGITNKFDPFPLDNASNPALSLPCPGDVLTTSSRTFLTETGGEAPVTSLAVSVTGAGKVTPQQKSPVVQLGTTYNFHAVANPGNLFAGWTGSINTTQPNVSFVLNSNMVLNARFVTNAFLALKGSFNGLFYDTNNVTTDSAGLVTVTVNQQGAFSGRLTMTSGVVPFGGQFDPDGSATVVALRGKKTPFSLNLQLDTTGGSQQITGTINCDTNWTATVTADRAVFGGRNFAPFSGNYTFAWQGTNDPTIGPAGDSYGTAFISRVGTLVSVIRLADNNTVHQVVPVSKDGNWPLFASLFGKEMLIGWVHIDGTGVMSGNVSWIRNAMSFGYYRAGFSNAVPVNGSIWVAPKDRTSGLNLSNPVVTLTGGNLAADLVPALTFNPNNLTFTSTDPSLSLKLVPSLGLFNGHFTDPTTSRVRVFNGVMLQKQNQARGFFLGADQTGAVRLDNP